MTLPDFDLLELEQQKKLISHKGKFIRSQLVGKNICDVYAYDSFYVLFTHSFNDKEIKQCHNFALLDSIDQYVQSVEGSK